MIMADTVSYFNNIDNLGSTTPTLLFKQRKRKRLSQVLDKLTSGNSDNNNEINNLSKMPPDNNDTSYYRIHNQIKRDEENEEAFRNEEILSNRSPHSSNESPRISFSPLRIKDEPGSSSAITPTSTYSSCSCVQCSRQNDSPYFSSSPMNFEKRYLSDLIYKRSHSDSDLPLWLELQDLAKLNKNEFPLNMSINKLNNFFGTPQEYPLDLSMKSSKQHAVTSSIENIPPLRLSNNIVSVPVIKGDVASPTTKESVATRYNIDVSPVVEEMPPGSDVAYVCPICGQMFSLHDRLAKHIASRHKIKQNSNESMSAAKSYLCEVCNRSFARSDMLTRHMRLHTGVKPYTCKVCNQVFSRSDHLSTHQRTHTGEKPYKCPYLASNGPCNYAACRRDMITRHLKTHLKYEPQLTNLRISSPSNIIKTSDITKNEITTNYK